MILLVYYIKMNSQHSDQTKLVRDYVLSLIKALLKNYLLKIKFTDNSLLIIFFFNDTWYNWHMIY